MKDRHHPLIYLSQKYCLIRISKFNPLLQKKSHNTPMMTLSIKIPKKIKYNKNQIIINKITQIINLHLKKI